MKKIALLDLGSNSTRMAIYQINSDNSFQEIKRFKEMTRLAEGMGETGQKLTLKKAAIERTVAALEKFKDEYEKEPGLTLVRGVATAAVRSASNSADFLKIVKDKIGVDIEILSGDSEAYYDYAGVMHAFELENCLICDMGGGSFELALVKDRQAVDYISIPYGAVTLSEKYNASNKINAADFFALQRFILHKFAQLPWLKKGVGFPLVLLGGANRTVARQGQQNSTGENDQSLHGKKMSSFSFVEVFQDWLAKDRQELENALGVEKERADIIIAGLTPVVLLLEKYDIPEVVFSESGVREGIIAELTK
ncbi:exopolyphosphatase [Ligilactobacillus pobuzihii]|uniref:Ppx/GppA family phosphatase n=1 Tax=Ligilactobacillus pobuzihii TaxID=449659 RepID=UPI0019D1155D|nr:Ppx/GppA family phosphatase [Ligilactobacillus pobuzihii]MBN7273748.1 exopolyphosphatase [Ligilactobacillus pobuzihii]